MWCSCRCWLNTLWDTFLIADASLVLLVTCVMLVQVEDHCQVVGSDKTTNLSFHWFLLHVGSGQFSVCWFKWWLELEILFLLFSLPGFSASDLISGDWFIKVILNLGHFDLLSGTKTNSTGKNSSKRIQFYSQNLFHQKHQEKEEIKTFTKAHLIVRLCCDPIETKLRQN